MPVPFNNIRIIPQPTRTDTGTIAFATKDNSQAVEISAADAIVSNIRFRLPVADGTAGQTLQTDGHGQLSFGNGFGGAASGGGFGAYYIQIPNGTRNGTNVDFFLDFVPSSAPTGTPPMVPIDLEVNGQGQSPYFPDYSLQPASDHIIMIVPPIATDRFVVRYFRGDPAKPVPSPGGGGSPVHIRASATQTSTSSSTAVTWPAGTLEGDTVMILVGEGTATSTVPAGWTRFNPTGAGTWDEFCIYKVLTAADIAAGSITIVW